MKRKWFEAVSDIEGYPMVRVRVDDLKMLLHGFDYPDDTALGSRPVARLRNAIKEKS